MKGHELARVLAKLPPHPPITTEYERRHRQGCFDERTSYANQRDHMVGWMREIDGPGAYGRKTRGRNAGESYNSLRCAPALIWMAEALGEEPAVVERAIAEADAAGPNFSSQCAAIRKVVPWSRIESLVELQSQSRAKFRIFSRK